MEMMLPELNEIAGWMCFSSAWTNPVIWAHYADQHRGLCLGFDVPGKFCQKIAYVEKRKPFPPDLLALNEPEKLEVIQEMLFTKCEDWRYEEEIRVTVKLDKDMETNGLFSRTGPTTSSSRRLWSA
jgi:hypothetical protein